MSSEDKESQEDELLALASIYDEDEFKRAQDVQGGETRISVDVPQNFRVSLSGKFTETLQNSKLEYAVSFLPPVVLNFEFPADYPSTSPPLFTLNCKWLSQAQLTALCRNLDNLWEENRGSVVLFAWMQFLKEETLAYLNITSPFEPEITKQEKQPKEEGASYDIQDAASAHGESSNAITEEDVESLSILIKEILDFDQSQKEKEFNCKMFTCNICFSVKQGSECMDFKDCRHVYCKICVKNYFEIQIKDGQVHCLNCPEPQCSSVATPGQVKELVEEKLFALYDRLLLQSSLDLMADVVYCPRPSCQTPVMQDPSCTMGICSRCNYAFCTLCKMTYHGVSPCKVTAEKLADLRNEYLEADQTTKQFWEKRYGKRVIQKALEEMESKKWLECNSKSCPCCGTPIEKLNGCNRMRCTACMQYFCWLCMRALSRINPYKHFSDPGSPCFNLLFQMMEIDE
ncbi:E3 ubiquitin-protein ligase RNF14 [Crotalus tigris]|uniref:E3 ubiquitin-protein ligase RNF14 n=1 Tax=Crotalus tigris TaxID=88082 RepID=UPI00192F662C|nr:E3 ubiquitin-protein ligase RNF14 [Crotalus tigris]XP_039207196.1 E3 ubiquitin-protein ligase RNF14 [Crotalus tigris]XP_039207205.1 E3 ubiquitin-protein ligase RNF14 [Crotalus tigris]XP_039207214.1 E3 ubiquitin-protein ligase RNF14 [Crotalus tigris]XP_039207221.1 E3 ubiquitin-protein ligase RNF14 [Crotalus tigris]XP_039207230.1 E3 ubiquitin-protein ligase RNF14 [Crotalus tigris]XP_039207236.1 E3 ubiquitin-protein ligase RNF14 [Crotalus tigris]XP_039207244.1 E3 ubiquitin-protein ligase RNF